MFNTAIIITLPQLLSSERKCIWN